MYIVFVKMRLCIVDQMKILYRKVPRQNKFLEEWLQTSISSADESIKASIPFIKRRDKDYYKLMKHVIERSTPISKPYRQLDFRYAWNATAMQNNTRMWYYIFIRIYYTSN